MNSFKVNNCLQWELTFDMRYLGFCLMNNIRSAFLTSERSCSNAMGQDEGLSISALQMINRWFPLLCTSASCRATQRISKPHTGPEWQVPCLGVRPLRPKSFPNFLCFLLASGGQRWHPAVVASPMSTTMTASTSRNKYKMHPWHTEAEKSKIYVP